MKQMLFLLAILAITSQARAANIVNKWRDYEAGKLTGPTVVQLDRVNAKEYLIWVFDGNGIVGPMSRSSYNESSALSDAKAIRSAQEAAKITAEAYDGRDVEIAALKAENAQLKTDLAKAQQLIKELLEK